MLVAIVVGSVALTSYTSDEKNYYLYALAYDASSPPPLSGVVISGSIISSVNGVRASDVVIEATGAQCDRTNTGFECSLEVGANNTWLTISNYVKGAKILLGCSDVMSIHGSETSSNNWTRFNLPAASTTIARPNSFSSPPSRPMSWMPSGRPSVVPTIGKVTTGR